MIKKEYDYFLVKQRNGGLLKFCYDSQQGICYKIFMEEKWSGNKSVYKDSFEYFYVFERENGEVNVFCQDICGDIILCTLKGIEWQYKTLLHMKCNGISPVQIRGFFYCDDIHLLYNIVDKNTYKERIVHQIYKNSMFWSTPQIISKSECYSEISYRIYQEVKSKITIVNTTLDGVYKLTSISFYALEEKWGKEEIIHTSLLPYRDFAFLGEKDRKHYLFITQDDQINRVVYQHKEIGLQKNTILFEYKNINSCSLILVNEVLWVLWVCGSKLYKCFSVNYGKDFSIPKEYRQVDKGLPVKVFYQEYLSDKKNNYVINDIYTMSFDRDEQLFSQDMLGDLLVTEIDDDRKLKYSLRNTSFEEEVANSYFEKDKKIKREEELEEKLKSANEELKILKDAMKYEKNRISNLQYKFDKEKEKNKVYINDKYILKEKNKNDISNQVKFSLAKWLFNDENNSDS